MITCGTVVCYDDNAYCCLDDYGDESCCVTYYYYQSLWFWFMWGAFLVILASCFVGCFRLCRRRRSAYVILGNSEQPPAYGSVTVQHSSNTNTPGSVPMPGPVPTTPTKPPAYVPYPEEKPPAYTATQP